LKKYLLLALKILISLALLGYIVIELDWSALIETAGTMAWWGLPLATLTLLVTLYLGTVRWAVLLRTHHPEYHTNSLFRPYLIAALFNNVLPSSTGGDLIRSFYIYRYSRDAVCAVSPVITERVLGLVVLVGINVLAIYFTGAIRVVSAGLWSTLLILLAVAVTVLGLTAIPATYWPLHRLLERLARFRVITVLLRIGEATHGYLRQPGILLALLVYSVAAQMLAIMIYLVLSRALSVEISFTALLVVVPLGLIMASLPISLGGIGVRELTVVTLLTRFGVNEHDAAAVALFFIPVVVLGSLPGLYYYLTGADSKEIMRGASSGKLDSA
jgi:hypothetical protein